MIRPGNHTLSLLFLLITSLAGVIIGTPVGELCAQEIDVPVLKQSFEGNVPKLVKSEILGATETVIKNDARKLTYLTPAATMERLTKISPALAGCDQKECLTRVGEVLGTTVAVSIEVIGEAQIYDFDVKIYDLKTGNTAASEKFSCDICTATETATRFAGAFTKLLSRVTIEKPQEKKAVRTLKDRETPPVEAKAALIEVRVKVLPESAVIALEQAQVGVGEATFKVAPGTYTLTTRAAGYAPLETTLDIKDGTDGPVNLNLAMTASEGGIAVTPPVESTPTPNAGDDVTAAYVVGGVLSAVSGLALAVTGAFMLSIDGDTTCTKGTITQCPNVYETSSAGITLVALGAAGITTGAFLFVLDSVLGNPVAATEESSAPTSSVDFGVGVAPEGGQVFWRAAW